MTQKTFVNELAVELALPKAQVERVVDAWMEKVVARLVEEGRLELRGFGVFTVKDRKGYKTQDPRNGEQLQVAPSRQVHFKASKALKTTLEEEQEE